MRFLAKTILAMTLLACIPAFAEEQPPRPGRPGELHLRCPRLLCSRGQRLVGGQRQLPGRRRGVVCDRSAVARRNSYRHRNDRCCGRHSARHRRSWQPCPQGRRDARADRGQFAPVRPGRKRRDRYPPGRRLAATARYLRHRNRDCRPADADQRIRGQRPVCRRRSRSDHQGRRCGCVERKRYRRGDSRPGHHRRIRQMVPLARLPSR